MEENKELRKLTREEETILNLIIKQREESDCKNDCFIYSVDLGQKELQTSGKATEYGIGRSEHSKIIQNLANENIINANWVTSYDKKGEPLFRYRDSESMLQDFGIDLITWQYYNSVEPDDMDYSYFFFVQLSFDHIKKVNDNCIVRYLCTLSYDPKKLRIIVKANNGQEYVIKRLRQDSLPYRVLLFALKNARTVVTRDDLKKNEINPGKKSIATQVFDKKNIVNKELSVFTRLTNDSIYVDPIAYLTLAQLEGIKKASF